MNDYRTKEFFKKKVLSLTKYVNKLKIDLQYCKFAGADYKYLLERHKEKMEKIVEKEADDYISGEPKERYEVDYFYTCNGCSLSTDKYNNCVYRQFSDCNGYDIDDYKRNIRGSLIRKWKENLNG